MKLTKSNYFSPEANEKYMSVSQFKSFEACPAQAIAELRGDWQRKTTTSLLVGSYVDAHFEGTLDIFKAHHPEIFKRDCTLKSEYVKADEIISRIKRDKLFMRFMRGRRQKVMTGEIEGVPVKIKIDALHEDKIVDLKVMRDFEPVYREGQGRMPWWQAWRYDLQGAVYQEIVRQNTGKTLPFYLAAATKEDEPDIGIWEVPQEMMDFELEAFKASVVKYDSMKKGIVETPRCEKCDFCKNTKVLTEDNIIRDEILM